MDSVDTFVAVQRVWSQVSGNYDAEQSTRTLVLSPATTIADLMAWAKDGDVLGRGDVIVSRAESTRGER